jgi:MFS family permease
VAAQIVMVPMAMLAGRKADTWGRKPLFLVAFAILPLRGVLYTLSDNPYWHVGCKASMASARVFMGRCFR